jgi:hypothetical protein
MLTIIYMGRFQLMSRYKISYTTEDWWAIEVDATDMDEAMEKFHQGYYNHEDAELIEGGLLQDSVQIGEVSAHV